MRMEVAFSGAKYPRKTKLFLLHKNYRFTEGYGDFL